MSLKHAPQFPKVAQHHILKWSGICALVSAPLMVLYYNHFVARPSARYADYYKQLYTKYPEIIPVNLLDYTFVKDRLGYHPLDKKVPSQEYLDEILSKNKY
eukprot:TRINITY_DN9253_c0_g1_i1.p1 TRINITY_DN9253_c0_g1~~TRINITY_DN9253_c0_g1_i1.p1  ORF type:complete len:101 (+),score=18.56 TRINITY_DN9253_c0_g1_i1:18-320(+)